MRKLMIAGVALCALGLAEPASAQILGPEAYGKGVQPPPKRPRTNYNSTDPYGAGAYAPQQQPTPAYGSRTQRANRYDPKLAPDSSYTPILKNYRDAPPVQRFKPQPRPVYPY